MEQITKEELYIRVLEFRSALELKLNSKYLPLQKKMDKLISEQNISEYMKLEPIAASLEKEIEKEYDELLRLHKELHISYSKSN